MLSFLSAPLAFQSQTCGDIQAAYQANQCCSATSATSVAAPIFSPVKDTISAAPSVMTQLAWQDPASSLSTSFISQLSNLKPVGWHSALIAEATDAAYSTQAVIADGQSGDTAFPFGSMKVLATVGEYDPSTGFMLTGVPDGMGSYLLDDNTVRYVFQGESYGPMARETWPYWVNNNTATFTGSHVMYVDYNRTALAQFMQNSNSAMSMVVGAGSVIKNMYNLMGNPVGPRNASGPTANPHYSNTDASGGGQWTGIMADPAPTRADWLMQSLCAAYLSERHQWGSGMGTEDNLFLTNEEWTDFNAASNFTGIPAHAIDLTTGDMYAVGVFTLGGFEKIVEVNCGIAGYVCYSPSGYNGAFGLPSGGSADTALKNAMGQRPDGTPYVWPQNVVPARLYIGKKGYNAKGQVANDFLSRNGLAYGKLYGFATDTTAAGFEWRDAWHKNATRMPGDTVSGSFMPIDWTWDGTVRSFLNDGSWEFQHTPQTNYKFWNGAGYDASGAKTEHNSPDPNGNPRFIQTSTAGYYGIYAFNNVATEIQAAVAGGSFFPTSVSATYTNLQGELDITAQIQLGGKGMKANGFPQTTNSDSGQQPGKVTFEDIDGFEWITSSDGDFVIIQEDSGNDYGERMFISKVDSTKKPTFYFIAMSGGNKNTRMMAKVGIPAGVNQNVGTHEFSGVSDLTGLVAKDSSGNWLATTSSGYAKRLAERATPINQHLIGIGLQSHNYYSGVVAAFGGDRGGQVYMYQPNLPTAALAA